MPITWCVPVSVNSSGELARQLGQAEVGDLHAAALVEQDVFRLDVAVDDAFVVGELQGLADLRHDRQRLLRRQLAGLHQLPQIHAVDVLHEEVVQRRGWPPAAASEIFTSPKSYTATMCGWLSRASVRASRLNRSANAGVSADSGG